MTVNIGIHDPKTMKPKKIWCNLAVADLDRTSQFYTQLGFKFNGRADDLVSFFFGEKDLIIHFFKKEVGISARHAEPVRRQIKDTKDHCLFCCQL
jgi:predicted lactoylglutathione lyase